MSDCRECKRFPTCEPPKTYFYKNSDKRCEEFEKTVQTMSELKPCPFCGGQAEEDYAYFDYNVFGVHCVKCDAYVCTTSDDQKKAIEAWNRRVNNMQTIKIKFAEDKPAVNAEE